jgi:hypothetical protein
MGSNLAAQRPDGPVAALNLHLEDLPVDVFEVGANGLTVESLTGGHGMPQTGSSCFFNLCLCSCSAE